ncbi:hypothetical protein FACS189479_04970 [Spirochaetia bacterium]|nr:hypothetical protein FACS189479_04970 [Spirochaetia bacterium]
MSVSETRAVFISALIQSGHYAEKLADTETRKESVLEIFDISGEFSRCLRDPFSYRDTVEAERGNE